MTASNSYKTICQCFLPLLAYSIFAFMLGAAIGRSIAKDPAVPVEVDVDFDETFSHIISSQPR